MADVFAVFGTLLAVGIALPGLLLTWHLLLPRLVMRAQQRLGQTPWQCFFLGSFLLIISLIPILPLDQLALEAMETLTAVNALQPYNYRPINGTIYPDDEFGLGLRQVAMLIKAVVGLEVACLDVGGWDTHIAQGGSEGLMAGLLSSLAQGLLAFYTDLVDHAGHLLVIIMSEFGRRLKENGGLGTDHGHGGIMLLIGGNVVGGRIHGRWPGLAPEQLVGSGDLAVTTDYRDILAEIVSRRLNNPRLETVFPGYRPSFRDVVL